MQKRIAFTLFTTHPLAERWMFNAIHKLVRTSSVWNEGFRREVRIGCAFACLHVPHGFRETGQALEHQLFRLAARHGKEISIARPAGFEARTGGLSVTETSAGWLSRVTGISEQGASQTIAALGVKVAERVASNAGTPRTVLGISAALLKQPEVLVYSTEALDVEGCRTVHRFVASRCSSLCVVHILYPSVFGDGTPHPRDCPPGAKCVEVTDGAKV